VTARHPSRFAAAVRSDWPRIWLFSDERIADCLAAVRALPPRSGIVFRHYATPLGARHRLFRAVLRLAHARRHVVLLAGAPLAGADGIHGSAHRRCRRGQLPVSFAVHDRRELEHAKRLATPIIFVSPVFATRSHEGGETIGIAGFARLAGGFAGRSIALGGMNAERFRALRSHGAHGWAAIDALS
jgi:thiamine-phosphate pyrophosphorylase